MLCLQKVIKNTSYQLAILFILLVLVLFTFEFSTLDYKIQSYFYNADTNTWLIDRNNKILDTIFYSGIKKLFILFILSILFSLIFLRRFNWVKNNIKPFTIIFLSGLLVPISISALKDSTNMPCPNQLVEFGGQYQNVSLFEKLEEKRPVTRCYPAGHSSGGFALLALLFLVNTKKAKITTLSLVMLLAWSIGGYKIMIGDHFVSHTIVTMIISPIIIILIALITKKVINYQSSRKK
jgi:membrane-associated PAP2 superfamily phosphatase